MQSTSLNTFKRVFFVAVILVIFSGCAVQDWGSMKQAYRDFVAYYNGYFNAKDILEESRKDLKEQHKDNFDEILEIYQLGDRNAASSVSGKLDEVEKKATKVIQGYENSNWIDESYLLIGQARFYRQDYQKALESFRHISGNFRGTLTGNESLIWIIKTNTRKERYNQARSMVSVINSRDTFPEPLKKDLKLAIADLEIKRRNFEPAIEALEKAVERISGRRAKSRYHFILGQLHQRRGNIVKANEYYQKAAQRPESYELGFQARLNKVMTMPVTNLNEYREKREVLNEMVENENNQDYLDQLYYELARLELFIDNRELAMDHLKNSLRENDNNQAQRSRTLSLMAELHYKNKNFRASYNNYSELSEIIKDIEFPGSDTMRSKSRAYKNVTGHWVTIKTQDSIQQLGKLDDNELTSRLREIIETREQEEEELATRQQQEEDGFQTNFEDRGQQDGDWYFYNPNALNNGYQHFRSRYGERPRVDNWRFSSVMVDELDQEEAEELEDELAGVQGDDEGDDIDQQISNLKSQIPRSRAQVNASDNQIMEAYFDLGYSYYERLRNYSKTIEVLEELMERFPDNRFSAHALYLLYESGKRSGNDDLASKYSQQLQEKFPDSEFAVLVSDPESYKERFVKQEKNQELETLFRKAHQAFNNGNCETVNKNREKADTSSSIGQNYLQANFEYLTILCDLRQDTTRRNQNRVREFKEEHQGTDLGDHAENILNYLDKRAGKGEKDLDVSMFSNIRTDDHYYCFMFNVNKGSTSDIREIFSNFNSNFYRDKELRIRDAMIDRRTQIVMVREFPGQNDAMEYLQDISENDYLLASIDIEDEDWEHFVISKNNYNELMKHKNKAAYLSFFNQHYK